MSERVDVTLSVDPDTARQLGDAEVRARVEAELERLTRKVAVDLLIEVIEAAGRDAEARGLTEDILNEELAAWKAERRARHMPPAA